MKMVNEFWQASGLGINENKTAIIRAKGDIIETTLGDSPWRDIKTPSRYKYLGVLIGHDVTTDDIFEASIEGLVSRAQRFFTATRKLSHANRILAFNVFLTSKISYLIKFYSLPYHPHTKAKGEGAIRAQARHMLIRYHGTAFPYAYLIMPHCVVSPSPPLRDPWAWAMTIS